VAIGLLVGVDLILSGTQVIALARGCASRDVSASVSSPGPSG
jgi:hypothetical protein